MKIRGKVLMLLLCGCTDSASVSGPHDEDFNASGNTLVPFVEGKPEAQ